VRSKGDSEEAWYAATAKPGPLRSRKPIHHGVVKSVTRLAWCDRGLSRAPGGVVDLAPALTDGRPADLRGLRPRPERNWRTQPEGLGTPARRASADYSGRPSLSPRESGGADPGRPSCPCSSASRAEWPSNQTAITTDRLRFFKNAAQLWKPRRRRRCCFGRAVQTAQTELGEDRIVGGRAGLAQPLALRLPRPARRDRADVYELCGLSERKGPLARSAARGDRPHEERSSVRARSHLHAPRSFQVGDHWC
jgi:hypothetical protein